MPFCTYQDANIEYFTDGSGRGLLLVHGTGQNADGNWAGFVPALAAGRTVVRPHLPGSGRSTGYDRELTLEYLAGGMFAAADAAGLGNFDVIGHSLGTCIAMQMALMQPERIGRLVLAAGFASAADARMQLQFTLWQRMARESPRSLAELFFLAAFSPSFIAGLDAAARESIVSDIENSTNWQGCARQTALDLRIDMTAALAGICQPVQVIGCRQDYVVPVPHARGLAEALPNAVYAELDGGHAGIAEEPERFLEITGQFLGLPSVL